MQYSPSSACDYLGALGRNWVARDLGWGHSCSWARAGRWAWRRWWWRLHAFQWRWWWSRQTRWSSRWRQLWWWKWWRWSWGWRSSQDVGAAFKCISVPVFVKGAGADDAHDFWRWTNGAFVKSDFTEDFLGFTAGARREEVGACAGGEQDG